MNDAYLSGLSSRIERLTNVLISLELDKREQIQLQKQQLELCKQILERLPEQPSIEKETSKQFR